METIEYHLIHRIRWQYFLTLTFANERIPCSGQEAMYRALCRRVCRWYSINFESMLHACRREPGERGRFHLHALWAGLPEASISKAGAESIAHWWEHHWGGHEEKRYVVEVESDGKVKKHMFSSQDACEASAGRKGNVETIWIPHQSGFATVDVFNQRLNGVGYCLKTFGAQPANLHYEVGRFGGSHCQLMLSKSVVYILLAALRRAGLGANGRVGYYSRVRRCYQDSARVQPSEHPACEDGVSLDRSDMGSDLLASVTR